MTVFQETPLSANLGQGGIQGVQMGTRDPVSPWGPEGPSGLVQVLELGHRLNILPRQLAICKVKNSIQKSCVKPYSS